MKKIAGVVLLIFSVIFAFWGIGYVKESGLLKAYPDAVYMDENQTEKRVFYQYFTQQEKAIYTALYNGVMQKMEYIELPYEIDGRTYEKIYITLEKQEPEFFYLSNSFYTAEKVRTARIEYREEHYESDSQKVLIENQAEKICNNINSVPSDFDKLLFIHDYIALNCSYVETGEEYLETVYGCLVNGSANCEGYAKTFKYLCDKLDIPCMVTVGVTSDGVNHAWNQVQINGEWYNVDVTWDDTEDELGVNHVYFLNPDADFVDHRADVAFMPVFECLSDTQNFYHKKDLLITIQDDAERILTRELADINGAMELKFADKHSYSEFKNVYLENQRVFDLLFENNPMVTQSEMKCVLKEYEQNLILILQISFI